MGCANPETCRLRAETHRSRMDLVAGEEELALIREHPRCRIRISLHAGNRMALRAIAAGQVAEALREGYVIERVQNGSATKILVMAWVRKSESRGYRPLHVCLAFGARALAGDVCEVVVTTVYDPSSEPWRWDDNYGRRICFCEAQEQPIMY